MNLLLENFQELLITPEAVDQFNAQILGWAVQGKLVPPDPNDDLATMLLEHIKDEKTRLVKEGKIRKSKPLPPINKQELPFPIPETWIWTRLGEITEQPQYGWTTKSTDTGDLLYIRTSDISSDRITWETAPYCVDEPDNIDDFLLRDGDILISRAGSVGVNKLVRNPPRAIFASYLIRFLPIIALDEYVFRFLNSPWYWESITDTKIGIAVPNVNATKLSEIIFPLPPLAEQHRIVEKVESLLAQTQAIKEELIAAEKEQHQFNKSALYLLTSSKNTGEIKKGWTFIKDNFALLYTHPENVAELKQTILQMAVQGNLVPQDPNDEPASVLLERIKEEKVRMVKGGKIRKSKTLPPISEDERQYVTPRGWEWVRVGNITHDIHYGYTASADSSLEEYRMLRITDIQDNRVNWMEVPGCEIDPGDAEKYLLKRRDILFARTGGTVGKTYLVGSEIPVKAVFASYLIRVILPKLINEKFIKYFFESPWYWNQIIDKSLGTGQPNVNATSLSKLVFMLPPLAEQYRIVEKVESLFTLIEPLEDELVALPEAHQQLVKAVLAEV